MSTLFTVNKSWHNDSWVYEHLMFASKGDAILLIEDAVLSLHSPITLASFLAKCEMLGISMYALADDSAIRGITNRFGGVAMVTYDGFVDLVNEYQTQVAW